MFIIKICSTNFPDYLYNSIENKNYEICEFSSFLLKKLMNIYVNILELIFSGLQNNFLIKKNG